MAEAGKNRIWLLILALVSTGAFASPYPARPTVVILDSYHDGFPWSMAEISGLMGRLHEELPDILPSIEHMDTKMHSGADHLRIVKEYLTAKYGSARVDLVIALDNSALDLLAADPQTLFPGVPIVFAGYNNYTPEAVKDRKLVTGVAEIEDRAGTLLLALGLFPHLTDVLVVTDETATGKAGRAEMETLAPRFTNRLAFHFLPPSSFAEAANAIADLGQGWFVLLLAYATDKDGYSLNTTESTRILCADARVPVFVLVDSGLGHGPIGGMLLTGENQGRRAGDLALRILGGEDAGGIPVETKSTAEPMFDSAIMRKLGVSSAALPPGSLIINQPPTLMEKYGTILLAIFSLLAIMGTLFAVFTLLISRRRRAETALTQSESRLRVILDSTSDAIIAVDSDRVITDCNRAAVELFGYSAQEMIGSSSRLLHLSAENFREFGEVFLPVVQKAGFRRGEWEYRLKDGTVIPIETVLSEQKDPSGKTLGYVGVLRDIRERKRAEEALRRTEEQLRQAQKMEAVGRLAGGIAHDFNNLLTVIEGYSEMTLEKIGPEDALYADLQEIRTASFKAAALTGQLLAFSRKQLITPRVFNLNRLVRETASMIGRLIGEDVELLVSLDPELGNTKADPGQIEQVVMNLAFNARDAMPQGGRLSLETANFEPDGTFLRDHPGIEAGRFVRLVVADTGHGMDSEVLAHLFEPFFTTKQKGRGTGLGLSMAYGIVRQSEGHIFCTSSPGAGARFTLLFPRVDRSAESPHDAGGRSSLKGGTERILLVEDEKAVRRFIASTLCTRGYSVHETCNGTEALEYLANAAGSVDLVITDVVMPKMGGGELAVKIRAAHPRMKVLFITGYVGEEFSPPEREENLHLRKPFTVDDLVAKVRQVLDAE